MAVAAMASPVPISPRPSFVLALTLTASTASWQLPLPVSRAAVMVGSTAYSRAGGPTQRLSSGRVRS